MSLLLFQTGLAESLRSGNPGPLKESDGLRLTRAIRRSWCEGRTAKAARLTLMILPQSLRQQLIANWVDQGGGTSSFFVKEGAAFLEFILPFLDEPSHSRSVCLFELAIMRAMNLSSEFIPPDEVNILSSSAVLKRHQMSFLINFFCDPADLLTAVELKKELPSVSDVSTQLLIAPGIPGLCRMAAPEEIALINRLSEPATLQQILAENHAEAHIKFLLNIGAISTTPSFDPRD